MKKLLICVMGAFFLTKECTAANKHCLSSLVSDSWDDKRCPASGNIDSFQEFCKYICPPHHRFVCLKDDEENVPDNLEYNPGVPQSDHITHWIKIIHLILAVVGVGLKVAEFFMRKKEYSITKNKYMYINQTHYHGNVTFHISN